MCAPASELKAQRTRLFAPDALLLGPSRVNFRDHRHKPLQVPFLRSPCRSGIAHELALLMRGDLPVRPSDDHVHYPLEVLNRAADIFRMAGHMLGKRLLLFLLHHGLGVSFVDDGLQLAWPRSSPACVQCEGRWA